MADTSVAITAGSGTPIRVLSGLGAAGADQQVVTLADDQGTIVRSAPDGSLLTDAGGTTLFYESFDAGSGTYVTQLSGSGTVAPAVSNGKATYTALTTASSSSFYASNVGSTLSLPAQGFFRCSYDIQLDTSAALANSTRWWGFGTNAGAPTAAAPITSGVVFILDYVTGAFYGAVYNNSVRTQTVALTKPVDGLTHKYEVLYTRAAAYFLIDNVLAGSISQPLPSAAQWQQLITGSMNHTTGPSAAPTMVVSLFAAADGGRNNLTISDPTNPWKRAAVRSGAAAGGDNALVVGLSPNSPIPPGTNVIGYAKLVSTDGATVGVFKGGSTAAAAGDAALVVSLSPNSPLPSISTSVTPGTAATHLGKAAAATPGSTDTGVAPLFVRATSVPASRSSAGAYAIGMVDAEGKQIIQQYADPVNTWQTALALTTTTAAALKAAGAAGIRNYCTGVTVSNSSATTTLVTVLDGATVIWQAQVGAGVTVVVPFETPLRGTAATALNANLGTAVTSVYVSAQGFIGI